VAEDGVDELVKYVDSLITIPNEKLLAVLGKEISLLNAFKSANDILLGAVQGIAELITRPGLINVDFADVRTVMAEMGVAMMGSGTAKGDGRAQEAADEAIRSPLLEDVNLSGASGILVNITAGLDLTIGEFDEVGSIIKKEVACDDATVVVGTVIDPDMDGELRVTLVATGLGELGSKVNQPEVVESDGAALRVVHPEPEAEEAAVVDYGEMERPAIYRKDTTVRQRGAYMEETKEKEMEYLDIPAFLRRQAD